MVLEAIKNALKLAMASLALLIISNQLPNQFILFGFCFLICGTVLSIIDVVSKRPRKSRFNVTHPGMAPGGPTGPAVYNSDGTMEEYDGGPATESQLLIEKFINDILNYCSSQGENCTLMNQPDGLWVVRVNDETGEVDKILNLSMPDEKDVTPENIEGIIKRTTDEIGVKLNQLKN